MFKITHLTSLKCSLLLQKHSVLRTNATPKEYVSHVPSKSIKVGTLYLGRRKVMDRSLSLNQGPLGLAIQFF